MTILIRSTLEIDLKINSYLNIPQEIFNRIAVFRQKF